MMLNYNQIEKGLCPGSSGQARGGRGLMQSQGGRNRGSALLVTILITSTVFLFAVVVLQQIIPYSTSIRSMQDATQAEYFAHSEMEIARQVFLKQKNTSVGRQTVANIADFEGKKMSILEESSILLSSRTGMKMPDPILPSQAAASTTNIPGQMVVLSTNKLMPIGIRQYSSDTEPMIFGTSQKDPKKHTIRAGESLTWDLTGVDFSNPPSPTLVMSIDGTPIDGKLLVEFLHEDSSGTLSSFFGAVAASSSLDILSAKNTSTNISLSAFISLSGGSSSGGHNCAGAKSCILTLRLESTTPSYDFTLVSSVPVPDLNAVVIGDGWSSNGEYYQRLIEVIPTIQGI